MPDVLRLGVGEWTRTSPDSLALELLRFVLLVAIHDWSDCNETEADECDRRALGSESEKATGIEAPLHGFCQVDAVGEQGFEGCRGELDESEAGLLLAGGFESRFERRRFSLLGIEKKLPMTW